MNWLLTHESIVRLGIFLSVLAVMITWQTAKPYRQDSRLHKGKRQLIRFINNISLSMIASVLLRMLPAISATAAATWAFDQNWGLLNQIDSDSFLIVIVAIITLDLAIYWQHRLTHTIPFLWRLHRVHHSDTDFDVSTSLRFHPIELMFSMCFKMVIVAIIGAPVLAVIIFEIVLNASAMFNHTNVSLNTRIETLLRKAIVTPDMHRIHHSPQSSETNSNFGFFLSIWDRVFNSYQDQPEQDAQSMAIGLDTQFKHPLHRLDTTLLMPFRD